MAGYSINVQDAMFTATAIQAEQDNLNSIMRDLALESEQLLTYWKGNTSAAYFAAKAQWDEGMKAMQDGMTRVHECLINNAASYQQTDDDVSQVFRRR